MTGSSRPRYGRPPWAVRVLLNGRSILRLFLIGLLLLLFFGTAGAFQGSLSSIGAGQTQLAYTVAGFRNASSLIPIEDDGRFTLSTTPDAELQRYFYLDGEQGILLLRDGLKSLSPKANPLSSFPLQIVESPSKPSDGKPTDPPRLSSLYVHVLGCDAFLSEAKVETSSKIDRILKCISVDPVLIKRVDLKRVKSRIKEMGAKLQPDALMESHLNAYLEDTDQILGPPTDRKTKKALPHEWADQSVDRSVPSDNGNSASPVLEIFLLLDRANPGLEIFRVKEAPPSISSFVSSGFVKYYSLGAYLGVPGKAPHWYRKFDADLSKLLLRVWRTVAGFLTISSRFVLLHLDGLFLMFLQLRYPVLIGLGILLPLLVLIRRQRDLTVRRCLEPYMLLIMAQVLTLLVADALMGEGLMIWVGFFYTLLRLMQLRGVIWMSVSDNQSFRRLFDLRSRPFLYNLLRLEIVLWSINALGLGWHIIRVFLTFSLISPA